jgi:hypothetical protein
VSSPIKSFILFPHLRQHCLTSDEERNEYVQGRFTRTVRTNKSQPRIQRNVNIHPLKQRLVLRVSKRDIRELKERRRDLVGFGELERDDVVFFGRFEFGQFLEDFDLRLGLGGTVGVVCSK